jgi:TRAP transporter TAXI family solute receptor
MRPRGFVLGFFILALLATALIQPGPARAQQLPRSVTVGANPPGTTIYAAAGAISKVVTQASGIQMTVQPYSGATTYFPILNNGELDFGFVSGTDAMMSYQGPLRIRLGGKSQYPHTPNLRLVMRGAPIVVGLLVRKDSAIKTIYDVRGKRVTGEFPAQLNNVNLVFGHLASAGMTWDDVKVIPVAAVNEGIDALVQGRADVAIHSLGSAKVREANASVGVRHISADCSPQGEERLRRSMPGLFPRRIKAGQAPAVEEDTCLIAFDFYLATHRGAPEPTVVAVLKAIWENVEKLPSLHQYFKEWTRERAVSADVTIPYHPAAVQFYKQREVWKPEMDQVQQRLLALNP